MTLIPSPKLDQRMHPQVQVETTDVRPDVPHLLLAGAPDFLDVVKVLFDGRPIGKCFENLFDPGLFTKRAQVK